MTAALMLAALATVPAQAQQQPLAVPADWSAMPPLPRRIAPALSPDPRVERFGAGWYGTTMMFELGR